MKKLFMVFAAIAMIVGFTSKAQAQVTATGTATASALVSNGLEIAKVTDLDFGAFVANATATKTVTIAAADGARGGTAVLVGTTASAASFDVQGEAGVPCTVTVPTSITITGPGSDMVITTTKTPAGSLPMTGGVGTIKVGGSLLVGIAQTPGSYTGSFDVTVNY